MADHFTCADVRVDPHPGDSDPDANEALRRVRAGRVAVAV
ncbi:hypothetical protein SSPNP10_15845 [Streptomyces sp. NP10]|nr:hypothetical protein SSPNP10_15845 [Streptomyces sp. NP10]